MMELPGPAPEVAEVTKAPEVPPGFSFSPGATDPDFVWMAVGPNGIGKFGPTLESVGGPA